jgi:chromosome segregation ATPase
LLHGSNRESAVDVRDLFERIAALIDSPEQDLARIERTLTDGYAQALALEAERSRLEKRMGELALDLNGRERERNVEELSRLARRLDGNSGELVELRGHLNDLRRHAEAVRV